MDDVVVSRYSFSKLTKTACLPSPFNMSSQCQLVSFQDMLTRVLVHPELRVIVINGLSGSGKTWAAKAVCMHARSLYSFDNYVWISLSKKFHLGTCIEKIAACLSISIGEEFSIERTRAKINDQLTQRKFLLVLDNAYFTEEENILEHMGIPHPQQQNLGSKVIVTTTTRRSEVVMEPDVIITPIPLTNEESHHLLCKIIGKRINPSCTPDLANHFYGLPLAIILLAGALCDLPRQHGYNELLSHACMSVRTKVSEFHMMDSLVRFGYSRLPNVTTKDCLLYCLLFPQDQGMPIENLIHCWIMDYLIPAVNGFHEAKRVGKEILNVLLKHGMIHLEDNDHVQMHDVIRETISIIGHDKLGTRISWQECSGSPEILWPTSHLGGNRHWKDISENFFCFMGMLRVLDLSFTGIKFLPSSISHLTKLRMLLVTGCEHLEKVQQIYSLSMLEVLDASGCGSLKFVEPGSFDCMVFLKIINFSRTSIECLPCLAASMDLHEVLLLDCPCLKPQQAMEPSVNPSDKTFITFPYFVPKTGLVSNLQLGSAEDVIDWMGMIWLPCGLTFELSDGLCGIRVSQYISENRKTCIYASNSSFLQSLDKDSPLWLNCFQKFQIVISPLKYDQSMVNHSQEMRRQFIFQGSYFEAKPFVHSSDINRFLEINCAGIPDDAEAILNHAELISLKRVTAADPVLNLNARSMTAARELWIENSDKLVNIFLLEEVQVLSAIGTLQNLWISNMENLTSFCKGVKDVTSFSCLMHFLLDCCPKLTFLFPPSLCLPNLQTVKIRFCDGLERVFNELISGEDALPRLQSLQLWELPKLTSVCGGALPSLKDLKVRGCAKLKKIPVGVNENSPFFTTIIGEMPWWSNLIWHDESIKRWILFRNWGPLLPHLATEG